MIDTATEFVIWRRMMETTPGDVAAMVAGAPAWHADAACKTADTATFFPRRGEPVEPAKAICAGCPVRAPCLDDAMAQRTSGIWGGASESERRMIRYGRLSRAELDGRLARAVETMERRTAQAATSAAAEVEVELHLEDPDVLAADPTCCASCARAGIRAGTYRHTRLVDASRTVGLCRHCYDVLIKHGELPDVDRLIDYAKRLGRKAAAA